MAVYADARRTLAGDAGSHETHRRINAEIAQEKAAALGRAGERLEAALAHVSSLGRRLDTAGDPAEQARLLGEYETARVRALHARLALVIQREALGLRHHRSSTSSFPSRPGAPRPGPRSRRGRPRRRDASACSTQAPGTIALIWNPDAETMPRAARERLQLERLRDTLRWVGERVAFHRERLGPATVGALSDLAGLPFVRKTDLREQYPFGLLAVPRREVARIHASSGTKGKPTVAAYTAGDLDVWREVMARALTAAGARRGDLLHVAFGYGLFTGGLGFHDGAERVGMTVVPVSSGNTARHHLLLQDFKPDVIAATPSFALHLAETLADQGGKPRELGLRVGVFGAEPWTDGIRTALERAFDLQAFDIYGLSEIIGPGVAGECEARDGLHIADDHFLPEIIDPASGTVLPPGREGELVFTTVTKRAMPLVRYRTGDITTLTMDPCRCGRTSARMARVKGRSDDMLIVKGVNLYPSEIERTLLAVEELAPHYQLVVDRAADPGAARGAGRARTGADRALRGLRPRPSRDRLAAAARDRAAPAGDGPERRAHDRGPSHNPSIRRQGGACDRARVGVS